MTRTKTGITITTGQPLSWDEWVAAVTDLEARAKLAEQNGLVRTAKLWRSMIENMQVGADADKFQLLARKS
jgi:hypothetical protein